MEPIRCINIPSFVRKLYIDTFSNKNGLPFSKVRSQLKKRKYVLYIIPNKAFLILHPLHRISGVHIEYLAVDPEARSQGLGKKIMEWLVNTWSITLNIRMLSLDCNTNLEGYYNKFGFIRGTQPYIYKGIKYLLMIRDRVCNATSILRKHHIERGIVNSIDLPHIILYIINIVSFIIARVFVSIQIPEYVYTKRAS